jgi:hypothetical protein
MPLENYPAGLRAARVRCNADVHHLAEAIGTDVRSYYRYEQGALPRTTL